MHQTRSDLSSEDEEIRNLEVGDEIRLVSGGWAKILDIKFEGKGEVFNFSVNNFINNALLKLIEEI